MYVTSLEHPKHSQIYNKYDGYHHPIVLHRDDMWHLGRFPNMEKLNDFLTFAGLKLGELTESKSMEECGMFYSWNIDSELDDTGFSNIKDLPKQVKPFIGLSNGSLVTCYLYNDEKTLHIYRPNPNYHDIYKPLSLEEHINHCRINGYL